MKQISKYIFFLIIFSLSQFIGKAQISLSGKITDSKDNSALNSASIYIPDIKTGAVSKEDGSYEIKNIPNGTYLVEVSFVGFASQTKDVTINGKSVTDFSLERSTIESPEVVVRTYLLPRHSKYNTVFCHYLFPSSQYHISFHRPVFHHR